MLPSQLARRTAAVTTALAVLIALAACTSGEPTAGTPADDTAREGSGGAATDPETSDPIAMISIGSERYEATPMCVTGDYLSVRGINVGAEPGVVIFGSFGIEGEADIVSLIVTGIDDEGTQETWSVRSEVHSDGAIGAFGDYSFDTEAGTASGDADFLFSRVTPGSGSSEESIESGSFEFRC